MTSRNRLRLRLALVIFLFVVGIGCSDATAPRRDTCASVRVALCTELDAGSIPLAAQAASDAAGRIAVALRNGGAAASLRGVLNELGGAIRAGQITEARDALAHARRALAEARLRLSQFPGDAPDLTAIELALVQADLALK